MRMIDGGKLDDKIIAIPFSDPNYNSIKELNELPSHVFDEILHFFAVYKQLENKETDVQALSDRQYAIKTIKNAIDCYNEKFVKTKEKASAL